CGSYDRNSATARPSTTTRGRFATPTGSTNSTSTTRDATSSSTPSSSTTTRPGASTSTASTTRPNLNPASALPRNLPGRLATAGAASTARVAWSRTIENKSDLGVLDLAATATPRTLTSGTPLYFWLSPDGTRAIVHSGDADLAMIDLDTGVSTSLAVQAAEFQ